MSFAFLEAFAERDIYYSWCKAEQEKRQTASFLGLKECQRCGWCCAKRTCIPTPDELQPIADYLGLAVPEMIEQYMVGDQQNGHYFVRFANVQQLDVLGEFLDWKRTYDKGDCILYDLVNRTCKIWPVRPQDARIMFCWNEEEPEWDSRTEWNEGDLERICPRMNHEDDDSDYWE